MKKVIYAVFTLLFFQANAQTGKQQELIGDRPDQTESAFVTPRGYFQFEDGFIFENETSEIQNLSYSSMLLRYGLFENFELRFATSYEKIQQTGLEDFSGFSPLTIGAKIHVNTEKGWIPQIAFLGHINIAQTGYIDFLQDYHSAQMALTFNHTLNEFWSVGYSLGVEFPSDLNYSVGTYTLVSSFAVTDKIGAFIELYGDFSKYMYPENKINGGITFLAKPNFQLDFAGGYGISEYAADNYFGAGFIYLFNLK